MADICADSFDSEGPAIAGGRPLPDPPEGSHIARVSRGGAWMTSVARAQLTQRVWIPPESQTDFISLRLFRSLDPFALRS